MLDFWYSDRCTRQIKLFCCISTCILIYLASTKAQLSPVFVIVSLALGILIHVSYRFKAKIKTSNPHHKVRKYALSLLAIICFTVLIYALKLNSPSENFFILALQCLGFTGLGLFIVSIHQNRNPRFE